METVFVRAPENRFWTGSPEKPCKSREKSVQICLGARCYRFESCHFDQNFQGMAFAIPWKFSFRCERTRKTGPENDTVIFPSWLFHRKASPVTSTIERGTAIGRPLFNISTLYHEHPHKGFFFLRLPRTNHQPLRHPRFFVLGKRKANPICSRPQHTRRLSLLSPQIKRGYDRKRQPGTGTVRII